MQSGLAAPLAVYGGLPTVEDVALSPDGSRLAAVRTDGDLRMVIVATVADGKVLRRIRASEDKLRSIKWADDDNLILTTSITTPVFGFKEEWSLLQVYNVTRNEMRSLPGKPIGTEDKALDSVVGRVMVRHADGHTLLFVRTYYKQAALDGSGDSSYEIALFRCDLTTKSSSVLKVEKPHVSWLVDSQGRLAAEQMYNELTQRWSINVFRNGSSREVASGHAALDVPEFIGFGPTTDSLLVTSVENGHGAWRLLSIDDGKLGAPMGEGPFHDAIIDRSTDRLIGGERLVDTPEYVFFDAALQERWQSIVKAFDPDQVTYMSASSDYSKILVRVEGAKYGYRYVIIDLVKAGAIQVGQVYAGIDKPLEVRRITYAAADGLQIPAYLTLPRGRPPHNLPLVVLPHGGPAARDTAEFDWWSQALAEQGYAVLRPNYRGSTVDEQFLEAGYGQWGRKMQTDLSDGVRYLAKEGIADSARVCIVGASYGGYAALAGVTLDPGVFRCAVSVAGVSDLARMLRWEGAGGVEARLATRYWDRFWGVSGSTDPQLDTISPIKHIAAVKVPVLLIHGRDDSVVPFEQSQIMFDALRNNNKEAELVTLKKEDHWLSRGETRLQMLEATVAFLRAHNPPD